MKKNRKKKMLTLMSLLLICSLLFGCGASSKSADTVYMMETTADSNSYTYEMEEAAEVEMAGGTNDLGTDLIGNVAGRKIIKNADLTVESKDFDIFVSTLNAIISELGGYIQSSSQGTARRSGLRYADMTLRIPAAKLDEFISRTEGAATVTYRNIYTDDVTLSYVDTESHLKALRTEQETLLALLEKAESVEDLITIQSRLSEVRYEIESYESRLRTFDDQIDYSTVYLSLSEVERETQVVAETAGQEISRRLEENLEDIADALRRFGIDFVSDLPYILLVVVPLGILVLVIVLIVKGYRKKHPRRTMVIKVGEQQNSKPEEK